MVWYMFTTYQSTRRHITNDCNHNIHLGENLIYLRKKLARFNCYSSDSVKPLIYTKLKHKLIDFSKESSSWKKSICCTWHNIEVSLRFITFVWNIFWYSEHLMEYKEQFRVAQKSVNLNIILYYEEISGINLTDIFLAISQHCAPNGGSHFG
jgi:hypothetical protein